MITFTLRQLEYFVAACEAQSVTLAANRIPVSQSSVSLAITHLERALGSQLLIRHHAQGVSPTPEGRQFLAHARALLRGAEDLERFAANLTRELSGPLDLGCMLTLGPLIAPQLCQEFITRHPGVSVNLVEGGPEQLMAELRSGHLAIALTYDLDPGHDDLEFEGLIDLPPYAVFAEDDMLAQHDHVALSELAEKRLVLLDLPLSREYFYGLFAAEGLTPTIGFRSPRPETIRTMVANGFGYTLVNALPRLNYALDGRRLTSVAITGRPRPRTLGITTVKKVKLSRVATVFRQHCRELISPGATPGLHFDSPATVHQLRVNRSNA